MSNYHLRDACLSLKAKGLLSLMLSLPEGWDYTLAGLAKISKEGKDAIRSTVEELEEAGYIRRRQTQDAAGKFSANEYVIYEAPRDQVEPLSENPSTDNPSTEKPSTENPTQLITNKSSTKEIKKKNKKEKTPELTLDEMKPRVEDWLRRVGQARGWSNETLNQLYTAMVSFYSPRPISNNGSPPVKSELALSRFCAKLLRESGENPESILSALDQAVIKGWTTAYPKKPADQAPSATVKQGRRYECL